MRKIPRGGAVEAPEKAARTKTQTSKARAGTKRIAVTVWARRFGRCRPTSTDPRRTHR